MGDNIESFLESQRTRIRADAQLMYAAYHPGSLIPEAAVSSIMQELQARLEKTQSAKIVPRVGYSAIAFNPNQATEWSSPWGQPLSLLKGMAEFPRRALSDRFFLQGLHGDIDTLLVAMDVAGDDLVRTMDDRKTRQRAETELQLVRQLESAPGDAKDKCAALWALITTGRDEALKVLIASADAC
ncbi:hypothetical protein ACG0Z6_15040 [Roseateles sp. BYS180W]|uniref:Uncharacterized protein n=1 Tax=Roseateles rivi TaxID=3299028 RepID=A0ABW7FYW9_9BURK